MCDRVVALVDMDCFYCQVETKLNPSLKGKPLAVIQYNQWQGGGIIAVNYEARAFGVTRHLRGNEAKKKCPDIILVPVPSVREKADLTKYRDAGNEVAAVFCQFTDCVEKASVDEAYLDLTSLVDQRIQLLREKKVKATDLQDTYVAGFSPPDSCAEEERTNGLTQWFKNIYCEHLPDSASERLAVGAIIVQEMRAAVYKQTGFHCSAGIAHNKILAKLACGLHKPNRQTVLPQSSVSSLYSNLSIKKIRSLGGKFGDYITEVLGCKTMADLTKYSEAELQKYFDEKHGTWLYNIARGIDLEPVNRRLITKSIGCCKKFPGKKALSSKKEVQHWLFELSSEVIERLKKDYEQNKRRAKSITVSFKQANNQNSGSSRCGSLSSYEINSMTNEAYELLKKSNLSQSNDDKWSPPLTFLGISAGKFSNDCTATNKPISTFFKANIKNASAVDSQKIDYGSSDNKDLSLSKSSQISTVNSTKYDAQNVEGSSKSFLKKYFALKNNGSNIDVLEPTNHAHSVEETAAHISTKYEAQNVEGSSKSFLKNYFALKNNGSNIDILEPTNHSHVALFSPKIGLMQPSCVEETAAQISNNLLSTTKPDTDESTDKKSFFKRYYNMKNNGPKNERLEQNCAHSEGVVVAQRNMNSEVEQSESNVTKNCTDINSTSLDNTSVSWINPQEIFPDLDQLDSDVVDLLPSPMQRTLKLCVEKRQASTEKCNFVCMDETNLKRNVEGIITGERDKEGPVSTVFISYEMQPSHVAKKSKLNNEDIKSVIPDSKQSSVSNNKHFYVNVNVECNQPISLNQVHMKNIDDVSDEITDCEDIEKINKDIQPMLQSNESESQLELCPQCNKTILLENYLDHLDFHVAEDLHKQLNSTSSQPTASKDRNLVSKVKIFDKKKQGVQSTKKTKSKQKDVKARSITNFFTPI